MPGATASPGGSPGRARTRRLRPQRHPATPANPARITLNATASGDWLDLTGGAVAAPAYLAAGQAGPVTVNITPTAAVGTVVQGVLDVVSNASISSQSQVIAALPYAYTVGPAAP